MGGRYLMDAVGGDLEALGLAGQLSEGAQLRGEVLLLLQDLEERGAQGEQGLDQLKVVLHQRKPFAPAAEQVVHLHRRRDPLRA